MINKGGSHDERSLHDLGIFLGGSTRERGSAPGPPVSDQAGTGSPGDARHAKSGVGMGDGAEDHVGDADELDGVARRAVVGSETVTVSNGPGRLAGRAAWVRGGPGGRARR